LPDPKKLLGWFQLSEKVFHRSCLFNRKEIKPTIKDFFAFAFFCFKDLRKKYDIGAFLTIHR